MLPADIYFDAICRLAPYGRFKIKNVYDNDSFPDFPIDAIFIINPNFEYPDWDYRTVDELLEHCAGKTNTDKARAKIKE